MININNKDFNQVISIKNKMKHQGLMKEVKKISLIIKLNIIMMIKENKVFIQLF